jgi:DNA replication initiation complex subunit (GINS family)
MREYEKALRHSRDIINCRLKKIVSLASASAAQTNQIINNLTVEERNIYRLLRKNIEEWRTKILKEGAEP